MNGTNERGTKPQEVHVQGNKTIFHIILCDFQETKIKITLFIATLLHFDRSINNFVYQ